ncbi:MAG: ArsR family transcriptional regulator [Methanoregula sp.]|nr:ArsR family transcriptional regulator [Methanoregula sp.]
MNSNRLLVLAILLVCVLPAGTAAATVPSYATTHTITVQEDGSALWQIEYRTLLASDDELLAFDNYTRDMPSVYLPQVRDLMQRSADQASVAASRPMTISNVTGNTAVQTSPTGRYGVVIYSFAWSGFAKPGGSLAIGDAFAGGMYLARDNMLVIRYPSGWTVSQAEPTPDKQQGVLVWYGLRTFSPGEPRVLIEKPAFPVIPLIAGIGVVIIIAGFILFRAGKRQAAPGLLKDRDEPAELSEPAVPLSEAEEAGLEERITTLLAASGGEQYQSEIVKTLGLPKSTVSSALNNLHQKGVIQKVRKGRENLIRLVQDRM